MTELDQVWDQMLAAATKKADGSGRTDVGEYLRLRATNDAIRERGTEWLFETMVEIATPAMGQTNSLSVESEAPHDFARGASNMVGSRLTFRQGVRCLSVEAGWARTPSDGIMRNGALAIARILHFGMSRLDAEFRLVRGETLPNWIDEDRLIVDSQSLRRHFDLFLGH